MMEIDTDQFLSYILLHKHLEFFRKIHEKTDLSQPGFLVFSNIYQFLCCQGLEVLETISLLCVKCFLAADHRSQFLKSIPLA